MQKAVKDNKGKFQNPVPTQMASLKDVPTIISRMYKSDSKLRKPSIKVPVVPILDHHLDTNPTKELEVYWLGHSSVLLEMGSKRYLLDPVLSERASMFQNYGPKRMHPAPLAIKELRNIDAVILSHDHYDHMDYHLIKSLFRSKTKFYVPLGVGAILKKWGANPENVFEFNWWDSIEDGLNTIVALPARHFSGRGVTNRNETLWCSWCFNNDQNRVYFGGDSGTMPQFAEIGEKYGPFDLNLMPIGAYDYAWHDIHIFPHEAVDAHIQLNAKKMIPIHWATFNLAIHPWSEPIEQLIVEGRSKGIEILTPKIGEKVVPDRHVNENWWEIKE